MKNFPFRKVVRLSQYEKFGKKRKQKELTFGEILDCGIEYTQEQIRRCWDAMSRGNYYPSLIAGLFYYQKERERLGKLREDFRWKNCEQFAQYYHNKWLQESIQYPPETEGDWVENKRNLSLLEKYFPNCGDPKTFFQNR